MLSQRLPLRGFQSAILLMSCLSSLVWSAGLEVPVIAVSSQGTSNANSSEANDPSVIFYNPAGMTRLRGIQVSLPAALVAASTRVSDRGTTRLQDVGQEPDSGESADCSRYDCMSDSTPEPMQPTVNAQPRGILPAVLPLGAFFASMPVDDMVSVGLGVFSPGGGNVNYKSNWFGRYFLDSGAIETVNFNPSVALRFDDKHSVGMGASALVGHAKFKLQIDVNKASPYLLQGVLDSPSSVVDAINVQLGGLLPADVLGQVSNSLLSASPGELKSLLGSLLAGQGIPGLSELNPVLSNITMVDSSSTASGTVEVIGFGYGWNAGYLYQPTDKTRLGISYRSASDIRMNGKLDWDFSDVRASALGQAMIGNMEEFLVKNYRPDTDARVVITIPAKLNVGFFTELTDKVDVMLNYTFNKTSVIKNLGVELPNQTTEVKQGPIVLAQNWRDSFTAAAGINYHWSDALTLRAGLQFDQTPVASALYRHPALADNDRWMASLGIGYKADRNTTIDLAYSYLYVLPSDANYHDPCSVTYYENDSDGSGNDGPSECTSNGGTFRAHYYDTHAHILGLQLNKRF